MKFLKSFNFLLLIFSIIGVCIGTYFWVDWCLPVNTLYAIHTISYYSLVMNGIFTLFLGISIYALLPFFKSLIF